MDLMQQARDRVLAARRITALTGAGISAESGVPTFRGSGGLWQGYSFTDLASPEGFATDPIKVWEWYNWRRRQLMDVQPNAGHQALADLQGQKEFVGIATQNVDRLHQQAGSNRVIELHGSIWEVRCTGCETTFDRKGDLLPEDPRCERCGARLRPGVVWFGEALPDGAMEEAIAWARDSDVFIVAGTSSIVFPAASLAQEAKAAGSYIIEVNLVQTPASEIAHISLLGKSGDILPKLLADSPRRAPLEPDVPEPV